ncbi:MAG: rhomboid family intramembrane serine protease [Vicinamibacterales bacterium]
MRRSPYSSMASTFGPGPWSPAVRAIILANIAVYLVTLAAPVWVYSIFGLTPRLVLTEGRVWQVVTYLFVHDARGVSHILFNMLYVWMFGTELERRWGTQAFVRYYFITGVGAGLVVLVASLLPIASAQLSYVVPTIGASGAVYALLLGWAVVFPHRQILFMMIFPMSAWVFAVIMGAIVFLNVAGTSGGGVSHMAHLGGLVIGYLYLKGPGGPRDLKLRLQYRLARWRMDRMRRKFNVHQGGRDDWERRLH